MSNFYRDIIQKDRRFRSTDRIADPALLEPVTRQAVAAILARTRDLGMELMVFETYRSQERQAALFEQGVTQLRQVGVHHYGLAADLVKVIEGQPSWDGDCAFMGRLARKYNLIWGGDWGEPEKTHNFRDYDHVQRCRVSAQPLLFSGTWYPEADYNPYGTVAAAPICLLKLTSDDAGQTSL